MKKFAVILSLLMVVGIGFGVYAMTTGTTGNEKSSQTMVLKDKKPHPADCTCNYCQAKKTETKTATTSANKDCPAGCSSAKCRTKTDCKSADAKKCCKKSDAQENGKSENQKTDSK